MTEQDPYAGDSNSPGFLRALKAPFAALSAALHTRLELLVVELEEERERLKQTLVLTLVVYFGLSLGVILLTIFAVALFWEKGWIIAIGALALVYLGVGIVAGLALRKKILTRPGLFPATLAELGKDRDRLKSSSRE